MSQQILRSQILSLVGLVSNLEVKSDSLLVDIHYDAADEVVSVEPYRVTVGTYQLKRLELKERR